MIEMNGVNQPDHHLTDASLRSNERVSHAALF